MPAKTKTTKTIVTERVETEGRPSHPVDPAKVQKGHLAAFTYYGHVGDVEKHQPSGQAILKIKGLAGAPDFDVCGDAMIKSSASADQYAEEIKASKTTVAEILVASYNKPFTVCFDKADGSERVLRGRLVRPEPLLGRSHVEDLDIDPGHNGANMRQVDHRTIQWLVVDGVKYVVK